ncbi:hypothetical protein C8Q79DRAFT_1004868 [Trametes meyenii]|nr:hypothetical protein C8Q79DRAFT_1004868 [Trametes meyenii]
MSLAATDEYDSLPDPFEGVDFDQVPELCAPVAPAPPLSAGDRSSDYDSYFDDMDPTVFDQLPHLGPVNPVVEPSATAQSQPESANAAPPQTSAAAPAAAAISRLRSMDDAARSDASQPRVDLAPSSQYTFDELDDTVFLEVDEIERRTAEAPRAPALPNVNGASAPPQGPRASLSVRDVNVPNSSSADRQTQRGVKRVRSGASSVGPTPSKRSKLSRVESKSEAEVDLHASARKILSTMGDELTCSICYELPAVVHCTNPCGHSCCGECLFQWVKAAPRKPKCPVCRTILDTTRPIIPNFVLDSIVRHHITALKATGHVDWQPTGQLYQSYMERKEASSTLAERIKQWPSTRPRGPGGAPSYSQVGEWLAGNLDLDDEDEDEVD